MFPILEIYSTFENALLSDHEFSSECTVSYSIIQIQLLCECKQNFKRKSFLSLILVLETKLALNLVCW